MRAILRLTRALLYAVVFIGFWVGVAAEIRPLDEALGVAVPWYFRPVGGVLVLAGVPLMTWCFIEFVFRGVGTPAPFDPPVRLVVTGPYRTVRNPMYIGGFMTFLGLGLLVSSVSIVCLSGIALSAMHLFVVLHEEPELRRTFGAEYGTYSRTVRRWLPALRRSEAERSAPDPGSTAG